jgi:hypothetical protein
MAGKEPEHHVIYLTFVIKGQTSLRETSWSTIQFDEPVRGIPSLRPRRLGNSRKKSIMSMEQWKKAKKPLAKETVVILAATHPEAPLLTRAGLALAFSPCKILDLHHVCHLWHTG